MVHLRNGHWLAWLVLTISIAILAVSLALENGLMLGAGLIISGTAGALIGRRSLKGAP